MKFIKFYATVSLFLSCAQGPMQIGDMEEDEGTSKLADAQFNLPIKSFQLANGLRLLVVQNDRLPIFSYYTFFDVGGRYESRSLKTTGATHFLEHLMFKGTHKMPPGHFDGVIEGNGGSTNAYTTFDSTVYHNNMPAEHIEKIVTMEADRMHNLKIEKEPFEKEREVILEERRLRYENNPSGKLYLAMMQEIFKGTPYGGSVIGSKEDLTLLSQSQVEQFYKRFYTPDNAIVVVAGDVHPDRVYSLVQAHYGTLKRSHDLKAFKKKKNAPSNFRLKKTYRREIKLHGTTPVPIFQLAYGGVPLGDRKAFVLDILASILGEGESSHMNQRFVKNRRPLLETIYVANYNLKYSGVFFIGGKLLRGTGLKNFKRVLIKETKKVCPHSITERSLQKTKNTLLSDYYAHLQTNSGVAEFLGRREYFFGDYNYYKKELAIYDSIDVKEVKKACREIFNEKSPVFLSIWKGNKS